MELYLAHKDQYTGEEQFLIDHLINTAENCRNYGEKIGLGNLMYIIGLLHDIGKADPKWQEMITMNQKNKKIPHSTAGSVMIAKLISNNPFVNEIKKNKDKQKDLETLFRLAGILAYVISAHHGLYDIIEENGKNVFLNRVKDFSADLSLEKNIEDFQKVLFDKVFIKEEIDVENIVIKSIKEFLEINKKIEMEDNTASSFYNYLYVRLFLSILKNADIYDTINAYNDVVEVRSENKIKRLKQKYYVEIEKKYKSFSKPDSDIDIVRTQIAEVAYNRGKIDKEGIYRLDIPTGAGKTLVSLRYGINQLVFKEKERFIYITPFLSVLEQNALEIKKTLNDFDLENILEHHSNIVMDEVEQSENNSKEMTQINREYLVETWSTPIIISTMVQFFNSILKEKSSNIRRFSSLINSVIILDEVQYLPKEITYIFNLAMNFIAYIMKTNVILCTATQPPYEMEKIRFPMIKNDCFDIVEITDEQRKNFERTEVFLFNNGETSTIEEIGKEVIENNSSYLVVLNTKAAVLKLYNYLNDYMNEGRKVYYLSSNLCPKHRQDKINEIKNKLIESEKGKKEAIVCVSTPIIEAGVDLDFERLIRSYSGVDSLIQAIGRCNRHGKNKKKGIVKLVKLPNEIENISKIKSVSEKKKITDIILDGKENKINIEELKKEFYFKYFNDNYDDKMGFSLGKDRGSLISRLGANEEKFFYEKKPIFLKQDFKSAGKEFNLINDETETAIVFYKESENLIEKLILLVDGFNVNKDMNILWNVRKLLRQLQPYTVNYYKGSAMEQYVMNKSIGNIVIKILPKEIYDEKKGVINKIEGIII